MTEYVQDFELDFQFDEEELELYSCSLDSTSESLSDAIEAKTPLLYESKMPSRQGSIAFEIIDDGLIDTLDLNYTLAPQQLQFVPVAPIQAKPRSIYLQTIPNDQLANIIQQGSTHVKNNYKKWLSASSTRA